MNLTNAIMLMSALGVGGYIPVLWRFIFGKEQRRKKRLQDAQRQEQHQHQLDMNEAEVLSRLSTAIREEIREENKDLRDRMDRVIDSVCGLTDLLEELFPKITGISDEERHALRVRMTGARRAGST